MHNLFTILFIGSYDLHYAAVRGLTVQKVVSTTVYGPWSGVHLIDFTKLHLHLTKLTEMNKPTSPVQPPQLELINEL